MSVEKKRLGHIQTTNVFRCKYGLAEKPPLSGESAACGGSAVPAVIVVPIWQSTNGELQNVYSVGHTFRAQSSMVKYYANTRDVFIRTYVPQSWKMKLNCLYNALTLRTCIWRQNKITWCCCYTNSRIQLPYKSFPKIIRIHILSEPFSAMLKSIFTKRFLVSGGKQQTFQSEDRA